jgi:hypothetical protein
VQIRYSKRELKDDSVIVSYTDGDIHSECFIRDFMIFITLSYQI